jgi:hypothetical protein
MALARCRKCVKIASSAARTCPHCGVRNPTKKPVSPFVKLAVAFVSTAALLAVTESSGLRANLSQFAIALPRIPIVAPAIAESTHKQSEKQRLDATTSVASTLKNSMDNPNALVWETILSDDDGGVICLEYRVKDHQGEYSREYITYVEGKASDAPEAWNKYCAGKKLNNMIAVKDKV